MSKETTRDEKLPPVDPVVSLKGSIILFLGTCYLSILPATTTGYVVLKLFDPWVLFYVTGSWLAPIITVLAATCLSLAVLYGWSWLQAKLAVGLVMGFKEIPEGRFKKSLYDKAFQQFSKRHLVKKFSIWLYKFHAPRWLYRKYAGTFIKLGKHVEVPEWFPLEKCEIGDNTAIARQIVIGSHVVEGDYVIVKAVKIGKNCIIDSGDEMHRTCVGPGCVLEDGVIMKTGTTIVKDYTLKTGGIYEENPVILRVGEVSDLSKEEIGRWRNEVLSKNTLKSKMLDDWSSFTSTGPRVVDRLASMVGYATGIGWILAWWFGVAGPIDKLHPLLGPLLNIILLPAIFFVAYGFNVLIPFGVIYPMVKKFQKNIPTLSNPTGDRSAGTSGGKHFDAIEITDPAVIEKWKCAKWLKWRMVDRVLRSLFPDASALIYTYIGKDNKVALKSTFTEAQVDTDYITIGENSLLSVGTHVYAYTLSDGLQPRLVIKRTSIGRNCVIAPSNIMAGASIGDNVMLGIHSFVPEDMHLESNQMYAGNPAVDIKTFIAMKKQAKLKLGISNL